jgi:hypothetical protein
MKSFVRKLGQSERRMAVAIGLLTVPVFLAAEATNGLAYLPFYAVLAIDCARQGLRYLGRKRSKALLGAGRSKGSR